MSESESQNDSIQSNDDDDESLNQLEIKEVKPEAQKDQSIEIKTQSPPKEEPPQSPSIKKDSPKDDAEKEMKNDDEYTPEELTSFKEEINTICLTIFLNYSKYYYEEKDFLLSFQTLTKLLTELGLVSTKSKPSFHIKPFDCDLILKKISPKKVSKLNSTQFFNFIVILASKFDANNFSINPKGTLYIFVDKFLSPLYKYINEYDTNENPSLFPYKHIENSINELNKNPIDQKTLTVISNVYKGIAFIYKNYFKAEMNKKEKQIERLIKESMMSLVELCKNYEITPYLLPIDKIAIYFNCLIDKNENEIFDGNFNMGQLFTVNKFCLFLINVANNVFSGQKKDLFSKLLLLFSKMENSNGRIITEKKNDVKQSDICSLQLDPEVESELIEEDDLHKETENKITQEKEEQTAQKENKDIVENNNINDDIILRNIFDTYATIGDKLNFSQLTLTSYIKLLRDFRVFDVKLPYIKETERKTITSSNHTLTKTFSKTNLSTLSEIEANMIFFEICGLKNVQLNKKNQFSSSNCLETKNNVPLRMTFQQFVSSLEVIATRLHPDMTSQSAFAYLKKNDMKLDEYNKNTVSSNKQIIEVMMNINQSEGKDILYQFANVVFSIYTNYANVEGNLNFNNFFLIYKDFDIFPDCINLIEIKRLFFAMSVIGNAQRRRNESLEDLINKENINDDYCELTGAKNEIVGYDYLLWSLGVASSLIKGKENSNECERLVMLFRNMSKSKGVNNPRKLANVGRLESINKTFIAALERVKEKHPELFEQKSKAKLIFGAENMFNSLFTE